MKVQFMTVLTVCVLLTGAVATAQAENMDPLLKLLVDKGVITSDQAASVQAEYEHRKAAESATVTSQAQAAAAEAVKAAPAPRIELPKALQGLKIGTLAYISYQDGKQYSGVPGENSDYSRFTLKRGYIDIQKTITPFLMARVTPDVHQDSTGDWKLRLKYLYGKLSFAGSDAISSPYVEFGLAHMPWLDFEESINRFRMQDTMFLERNGLFNSADVGVMVGGNFGGDMPDEYKKSVNGHYAGRYGSFQVGLYNGTGYHASEKNTDKAVEARVTVRPLPDVVPGLQLSVFGISGKGNVAAPAPNFNLFNTMLSYESRYFVATGQYYTGKGNQSGSAVLADGQARKQKGYSLFTEVRFTEDADWSAIARYDSFDPNKDDSASDVQKRSIIGVAWQYVPGNYWLLDFENVKHDSPAIPTEKRVQLTLQLKY